uniref:Uncharacterized protein n=1 Tax=Schistosoma curassoni TaxID=6186 RepID=A0A183JSX8_9TREM
MPPIPQLPLFNPLVPRDITTLTTSSPRPLVTLVPLLLVLPVRLPLPPVLIK